MKQLIVTIFFLCLSFAAFSQGGWLRPNTSYGNRQYRIALDSTLFYPTGSGAPTSLRGYDLKQGALYFDSTNNKVYNYNPKTTTWSTIGSSFTTGNNTQIIFNQSGTLIGSDSLTFNGTYIGFKLPTRMGSAGSSTLADSNLYHRGYVGNDFWQVGGTGETLDKLSMVFKVGDNAQPYWNNGQRFIFRYDNSNSGTQKDPLVIDYDSTQMNTSLIIGSSSSSTANNISIGRSLNSASWTGTIGINGSIAGNTGLRLTATNGTTSQYITIPGAGTLAPIYSDGTTEYRMLHQGNVTAGSAISLANTANGIQITNAGTLQSTLTNGNAATSTITLGSTGNTTSYPYALQRNLLSLPYSASISLSGTTSANAGLNLLASNGTSGQNSYITVVPNSTAPLWTGNNGANIYNLLHQNNVTGLNNIKIASTSDGISITDSVPGANTQVMYRNSTRIVGSNDFTFSTGTTVQLSLGTSTSTTNANINGGGGSGSLSLTPGTGGIILNGISTGATTDSILTQNVSTGKVNRISASRFVTTFNGSVGAITYNPTLQTITTNGNTSSNLLQLTGANTVPSSGIGLEVFYNTVANNGSVQSISRTSGFYYPTQIRGGNNTSATANVLQVASDLTYNSNQVWYAGNVTGGTGISVSGQTITNTGTFQQTTTNGNTTTNDVLFGKHLYFSTTTPSVALGSGVSVTGSFAVTGNDQSGTMSFTVTSGTASIGASGTILTLTFAQSFSSYNPRVIIVPADINTANTFTKIAGTNGTSSGFNLSTTPSMTGIPVGQYFFNYHVF